jgi:hypothetical protein
MDKLLDKRASIELESTQIMKLTDFGWEDRDGVVIKDKVC